MSVDGRIYWVDHDGSVVHVPVFTVSRAAEGARIDLGADFDRLVLQYGRPGTIQGWDHRGRGLQEVRELDFAALPLDSSCPSWMQLDDHKILMRLVHSPQWVMVHASGGKVSKPVTGRWVFSTEPAEYARLERLPIVGEVLR